MARHAPYRRVKFYSALVSMGLFTLTGCANSTIGPDDTLAHYFDIVYAVGSAEAEREAARSKEYEESVAECMKSSGFEYTPEITTALNASEGKQEISPDSREYRAVNGYGIFAEGPRPEVKDSPDSTANSTYRDNLSSSEQHAYDEVLHGTETEPDASNAVGTTGGCYNESWDAVYGKAMSADMEWAELLGEVDELYVQIDDSTEVAELNNEWSTCLEESGFMAIGSPSAAEEYIRSLVHNLQSQDSAGLVIVDNMKISEIHELEIRLSLADLDCQTRVDYTSRYDRISSIYEKHFVDSHKAALESWLLSHNG